MTGPIDFTNLEQLLRASTPQVAPAIQLVVQQHGELCFANA
ncbi:MAG: hypothetical protein R2867_20005 [Caldilineaceae bacterium]